MGNNRIIDAVFCSPLTVSCSSREKKRYISYETTILTYEVKIAGGTTCAENRRVIVDYRTIFVIETLPNYC